MPELPEVESARAFVTEHCKGKTIKEVVTKESGGGNRDGLLDDLVLGAVDEDKLSTALLGRAVVAVHRRGKHLWIEFDGTGPHVAFHFGMTGAFACQGVEGVTYRRISVDTTSWPPKFTKCEFVFTDGTRLSFVNSRRLGRVRLLDDPLHSPPISELGFDPLLDMPSLDDFTTRIRKRRIAVKAALLDQTFSAGIGNWVADEVLFQARIHPARTCDILTDDQIKNLHAQIREVVHKAVAVNADHTKFPDEWLFHRRWGKGKKEKAKGVSFITVGGRTTAFMPKIQGSGPGNAPKRARRKPGKAALARSKTTPAGKPGGAGTRAGASAGAGAGAGSGAGDAVATPIRTTRRMRRVKTEPRPSTAASRRSAGKQSAATRSSAAATKGGRGAKRGAAGTPTAATPSPRKSRRGGSRTATGKADPDADVKMEPGTPSDAAPAVGTPRRLTRSATRLLQRARTVAP